MNDIPHSEYPRPQFVRDNWMNLNGTWQFELDPGESGLERDLWSKPELDGTITVPFCPESRLSGIAHTDFIRACWYRRKFDIAPENLSGRVLMHFEAVYYDCIVRVNGVQAGKHIGGHSQFTLDITRLVHEGENDVTVYAHSDVRSGVQPIGKQCDKYYSAGCSYTRTTGIWQTVWLEFVPVSYMNEISITPDLANSAVYVRANVKSSEPGMRVSVSTSYEGKATGATSALVNAGNAYVNVPLSETHLWEVGNGRLYDMTVTLENENGIIDTVRSYFGMRSVETRGGKFLINGKPVFMKLVLDQGFNPEGIITPPDDDFEKADIERSMAVGFNGARLHQKVFDRRMLYHADKAGYILWGEYPNWGLDTASPDALRHFLEEWREVVVRDCSSPSIIGWCPFNETSTNSDLFIFETAYNVTKSIDPTRPVIDTSGWTHCGLTDIFDYHDYTQEPEVFLAHLAVYGSAEAGKPFPVVPGMFPYMNRKAPGIDGDGQPIFISEFGGIGWNAKTTAANAWGYGNNPKTEDEFFERLTGLFGAFAKAEGICGFCYTQLTDVEQEINGIYTYDRTPKFDTAKIRKAIDAGEPASYRKTV